MEASGPPMRGPLLGEEGGNRSQRELRSRKGLLTQNPGDVLYPSADSTLFRANRAAAPGALGVARSHTALILLLPPPC